MMENFVLWLLIVALLPAVHCSAYDNHCTVHIVLQGATGDLAKRYLWSAIFNSYVAQIKSDSGCKFSSVTASSREPASKGDYILAALDNTLKCPVATKTPEQCSILKIQFSKLVWYHQLKYEEDYSLLAVKQQELDKDCVACSVGKLFYLSVPPHAYSSIAKHIHVHLRPKGDLGWLRVLFEKPFGSDLNSAMSLHNDLGQYLQEDEIYRVDHYLGKNGVQQILSFRHQSIEQLQDYWNNDHISHIEVVIKEKVDCSGRTKFYDQYGVIRDVFQNHLTEMLTLVGMQLTSERDSRKIKFLNSLFPPRLYNAVLGQYDGYISHLVSDGVQQNAQNVSHTPTYASVVLFSKAPQWVGVPFFLTSGKSLGKKSSYIRVVFKDTLISSLYFADSTCNPEIIFIIQDDHFEVPGILVSEHFVDLISVGNIEGWKKYTINTTDFVCRPYVYLNADSDLLGNDAYTDLLQSALLGNKDKFVSTERLFALWKIWSPLLEEIEAANPHIQLYSENTLELLRYKRIGSKLHYIQLSPGTEETLPAVNMLVEKSTVISSLLQSNVIVGNRFTLADQLTLKLKYLVSQAANHGVPFHMALPGGTSPELFYQNLVMEHNSFPWDIIHIWQVDERCVPYNSLHSNLHNIDIKFFQLVPIPRSNIHPMIDNHGACHDADIMYQAELLQYNAIHDMVILGLGKDGHIASLFANMTHSNDSEVLVTYVKLQESHLVDIKERITMTFNAILQAKYVAVLAVDDSKCDVVTMLLDDDGAHLPAARLLHQPNVFWYIDHNCVQNNYFI